LVCMIFLFSELGNNYQKSLALATRPFH
jgi:hypothetical protein